LLTQKENSVMLERMKTSAHSKQAHTKVVKKKTFSSFSKKYFSVVAGFLAIFFALVGVLVALRLNGTNQDTREQASGGGQCVGGPGNATGACGDAAGNYTGAQVRCDTRPNQSVCNSLAACGCSWQSTGGTGEGSGSGSGGSSNSGIPSSFSTSACTSACQGVKKSASGGTVGGRYNPTTSTSGISGCECYCTSGGWSDTTYSVCTGTNPVKECTPGAQGTRSYDGCAYTCTSQGVWAKNNSSCGYSVGGGTGSGGGGTGGAGSVGGNSKGVSGYDANGNVLCNPGYNRCNQTCLSQVCSCTLWANSRTFCQGEEAKLNNNQCSTASSSQPSCETEGQGNCSQYSNGCWYPTQNFTLHDVKQAQSVHSL
jgi:hypothetical protein